jgi:radical SAM superfamily enzyme YgiQ (UPF0313 family)
MATFELPVGSSAANQSPVTHPKGAQAKVLLTSVFGPFACDDEHGSRKINPMELWHNQVTRVQGPFSLRMFNRSWGLMMIQANIEAPCAVLDFPTLERFEQELREHRYDVVGITAIPPNVIKVEEMCRLVRHYQPDATIVVGGHVAAIPDLEGRLDADWIVRGEGIKWFREFLGDDSNRPNRHPLIESGFGVRTMGSMASSRIYERTATLIPSVGCPLGCDFCSTSALFGGKGNHIAFYESGDSLFDVMCQIEKSMDIQSFFVMDENFLLYRPRALRLLELMEKNDKAWSLQIFSSANVVRSYSTQELVRLGLSWLWVGLEGEDSGYAKLKRVDTFELVRELRSHGVRVLGSTILGFPDHSPDNMERVIDYAVRHNSDFHQFMFYSPSPGTPFYHELEQSGQLKDESEFPWPDWHGQLGFSWRHPNFSSGEETKYILRPFTVISTSTDQVLYDPCVPFYRVGKGTSRTRTREYVAGFYANLEGWANKAWPPQQQRWHTTAITRPCTRKCLDCSRIYATSRAGHHVASRKSPDLCCWKISARRKRESPMAGHTSHRHLTKSMRPADGFLLTSMPTRICADTWNRFRRIPVTQPSSNGQHWPRLPVHEADNDAAN